MRKRSVVALVMLPVVMAVVTGVDLAARAHGRHWYNSWPVFKTWMDQSNWSSLVVAIAVPGVFTYGYVAWQHRKSRAHVERHVAELHERMDAHAQRHLHLARLLHVRLGGTPQEWDEHMSQIPASGDPVRDEQPPRKG